MENVEPFESAAHFVAAGQVSFSPIEQNGFADSEDESCLRRQRGLTAFVVESSIPGEPDVARTRAEKR